MNGSQVSTWPHSILNEYSQLDTREATIFIEWSLADRAIRRNVSCLPAEKELDHNIFYHKNIETVRPKYIG